MRGGQQSGAAGPWEVKLCLPTTPQWAGVPEAGPRLHDLMVTAAAPLCLH